MSHSVQFWNAYLKTLKEEGLFKENIGDRYYIENKPTCGIALVLRLNNLKQPYGHFEDLDALRNHMVLEFMRKLETMVELAQEKHNTTIDPVDIYITARELEVSLC